MNQYVSSIGRTFACVALCGGIADAGAPARKENTMTARGTFTARTTPQPRDDAAGGPFARLFLDKQFEGDLQGAGKGQMLAAETGVPQSAGYVALELVTGVLHGKRGSFILQHRGTMRKGSFAIDVTVVPDSGTGELSGISGTMTIHVEGRDHSYAFEYRLEKE